MWQGYVCISVCYLILVALLLWFVIGARGKLWAKVAVTAAVVWYTAVLYFAIPNFFGWPTSAEVPDGSWIRAVHVEEPTPGSDGGIYLWLITQPPTGKDAFQYLLDPFSFTLKAPRAFKLPYSKPEHKELETARKLRQKTFGSMWMIEKDEQTGARKYKVKNPWEFLKKEEDEASAGEETGVPS